VVPHAGITKTLNDGLVMQMTWRPSQAFMSVDCLPLSSWKTESVAPALLGEDKQGLLCRRTREAEIKKKKWLTAPGRPSVLRPDPGKQPHTNPMRHVCHHACHAPHSPLLTLLLQLQSRIYVGRAVGEPALPRCRGACCQKFFICCGIYPSPGEQDDGPLASVGSFYRLMADQEV